MATTLLEMTNSVLKRLREKTVTTVEATEYSRLVVELLNEAKREVEDAWNWGHIKATVQIITVADEPNYTLSGVSERFRPLYDNEGLLSCYNLTENGQRIYAIPSAQLSRMYAYDPDEANEPSYIDFNGYNIDGEPQIQFYPVPDAAYEIVLDVYDPQGDLTLDTDTIVVPPAPVIMRAWALAISERGEDGGVPYDEANRRADKALSDAIQLDANQRRDELIVRPV